MDSQRVNVEVQGSLRNLSRQYLLSFTQRGLPDRPCYAHCEDDCIHGYQDKAPASLPANLHHSDFSPY